jgi:hypothetical protein
MTTIAGYGLAAGGLLLLGFGPMASAAPTTLEGFRAADAAVGAESGARLVRFDAYLQGRVPPRQGDGPFRPVGQVTPMAGADAVFGQGPGAYETVIQSNADGKGGFLDSGVIRFSTGEIRFRGRYPTRNEPTPVKGVANTVMVEEITGGAGAFEGVTGHFLLNSTLGPDGIRGALNGVLFVKRAGAN